MTQIVRGERVGIGAQLSVGCNAAIFEPDGARLLLTQRCDSGLWCLPGGHMEAGETAAEACIREVREETGLSIEVTGLVGVYTSPDIVIAYSDGRKIQNVTLLFRATIAGGEFTANDEMSVMQYFEAAEANALQLKAHHYEQVKDAFLHLKETIIK